MGVVYRAVHLALDRTVALKVISAKLASEPGFRDRFRRESRLAASIEHPHVIPVYHAGEERDLLFITMRFVHGSDVRRLLKAHGSLGPQEAAEIVSKIGGALDAAHAHGLVHRDVKPANILLGREGEVFLTDFGLTRHESSVDALTGTGEWLGTVDFTAPEQIRGDGADARTDVYALGCVLYQMLTELPPYRKDSAAAVVFAHLNDPVPSLRARRPDLPAELDDVVARALAKDPDERFQSAGELGEAALQAARMATPSGVRRRLEDLAAQPVEPDTDPAAALPTKQPAKPRRRRTHWLTVGAAAVLLAFVLGWVGTALLGEDEGVSAAEVRTVLDRFAARYTNEDVNGLAALFAPEFRRTVAGGAPQDRAGAIGRIRRIFQEPQAPRYVLEDVRVTTDGAGATARGRFMAEGNDLYGTGEIEFRLSRHGDKVLIDALKTVPDINQRVPVQRAGIPVDAEISVRMQSDGTLPKGTVIAERSFTIQRYEPERYYRLPLNAAGRRIGRGEKYEILVRLTDRFGKRFRFDPVVSELE